MKTCLESAPLEPRLTHADATPKSLVLPKPLEPIRRRHLGVPDGVLDVPVAEVVLDRPHEEGVRNEPDERNYARRAGPRFGGVRSSAGSGWQLRPDTRVRTRRSAPGCRRRSGHGGFGRQAAWQRRTLCLRLRRCRGGIWCSPIGSRSRSGAPKAMECARSRGGWRGRHRRSRGSCAATPPHGPAAWSTERRRPSGMRIAPRAAPSRRSSRSIPSYNSTCRSG
jgi:hypothetical protein